MGKSVVAKSVYMIDFYIILGKDIWHACIAFINYRTRVVRFNFKNEPIVEWKGGDSILTSLIIFYLKHAK